MHSKTPEHRVHPNTVALLLPLFLYTVRNSTVPSNTVPPQYRAIPFPLPIIIYTLFANYIYIIIRNVRFALPREAQY